MPTDRKNEDENNSHFWDAAVIITIGTSVMYLLGWTYWFNYFKYFGIGQEFIDFNFERIISTTWMLGFSFIFVIIILMGLDISNYNKFKDSYIKIKNIALILLIFLGFFTGLYFDYFSYPWIIIITIGVLIISIFMEGHPFFAKQIDMRRLKNYSFLILVTVLFSLIIVYGASGERRAELQAKSLTGTKIILETSSGWQSPTNAIFITHMNNKYFIYNSTNPNFPPEIFIIEDSHVSKAILLPPKKLN